MSEFKYTDYKQVRQLAANILKDDKRMIELTVALDQNLKKLESSFLDDGIDEVKAYVNALTGKLKNAQTSFMAIASELAAYADILKSGK